MVLAIIPFVAAVSGPHLNQPCRWRSRCVVTSAWRRVPDHIITQLLGATLACLFLLAVFCNIEPGPLIGAANRGRVRDHPARPRGAPTSHAAGSGVLTHGRLEEKAKLSQKIDDGTVVPPGLERTSAPGGS